MARSRVSTTNCVRELYASISTAEIAPSAVMAAAVASGMGVSLLVMVAALPKTRSGSIDDRTALMDSTTALLDVQRRLAEILDTQTATHIAAARKMSQASDEQRLQREAAIQLALRAAAEVPLDIMRLSALGLKQAQTVAARACRAATADMELAVRLLRIGLVGARSHLELTLGSLIDNDYTQAVIEEIAALSDEGMKAASAAESLLRIPPA